MDINPLRELYNDIMTIMEESVIKFSTIANTLDTLESRRLADGYINAYLQEDTFGSYYHYSEEALRTVFTDASDNYILQLQNDKNLIPITYRNAVLSAQRVYVIDSYDEMNDYYRELNGLPNYGTPESEYIYVEEHVALEYAVPSDIPIHELSNTFIGILDTVGYIDLLQERYPTLDYLKYLGANKIDIVLARNAKNFALLKMPHDIKESTWNQFVLLYEQCREYFMTCIYVPELRSTIDHYDNFIAMSIMIMAIIQLLGRITEYTINREFFDNTSIKNLFEVYNVPYHENMDDDLKVQIANSLNILIQNKGTNQVIYDITKILGYDRIDIYKYYLMKSRKFENGVPVTVYKTDEETGEMVEDLENMYDIHFQKVPIDDTDTYKSLFDESASIPYAEITDPDPYWINDKDLLDELYATEYNFVETKYMGSGISYKMTTILFDNLYLLKMLMDTKDEQGQILVDITIGETSSVVDLFDTVVILCSLVCKYNYLAGNILTTPSKIMHVMGFNFDIDYSAIRYDILSDPNIDDELADFFAPRSLTSATEINEFYKKYKDLYFIIVEKMGNTNNIDVYRAYYKLYKTLFYTNENQKIFNIGTETSPVYPNTFLEYLQAKQPEFAQSIVDMNRDDIIDIIQAISVKIQLILPEVTQLGVDDGRTDALEIMMLELVRFFKSYTTDMIGFDVLYIYDLKPENLLRLIDRIESIEKSFLMSDKLKVSYHDTIDMTSNFKLFAKMAYRDTVIIYNHLTTLEDKILFSDMIHGLHTELSSASDLHLIDSINFTAVFNERDEFLLKDKLTYEMVD